MVARGAWIEISFRRWFKSKRIASVRLAIVYLTLHVEYTIDFFLETTLFIVYSSLMTTYGTKNYQVQMELQGPTAMWTRPDTGSALVSGPIPTFSASKGLFESIARLKSAYIRPTRVEICAPLKTYRYTTNYSQGPLRKGSQIRGGDAFQLPAVVLANVCYRLYGEVEEATPAPGATNHRHALQEMFNRRLQKGQCFRPVCLGWSEFLASYWGPFRDSTKIESSINLTVPTMLHSVFDLAVAGKVAPRFVQNVKIENGVLEYAL